MKWTIWWKREALIFYNGHKYHQYFDSMKLLLLFVWILKWYWADTIFPLCTCIPFSLQDDSTKRKLLLLTIARLILELTENMTVVYVTQPPSETPRGKVQLSIQITKPAKWISLSGWKYLVMRKQKKESFKALEWQTFLIDNRHFNI